MVRTDARSLNSLDIRITAIEARLDRVIRIVDKNHRMLMDLEEVVRAHIRPELGLDVIKVLMDHETRITKLESQ